MVSTVTLVTEGVTVADTLGVAVVVITGVLTTGVLTTGVLTTGVLTSVDVIADRLEVSAVATGLNAATIGLATTVVVVT